MSRAKDIGNIVRVERARLGLTQQQLADALGVRRPAIAAIEAGRRHLKAEEAAVLASVFGVGCGWLCDPPAAGSFRYKEP